MILSRTLKEDLAEFVTVSKCLTEFNIHRIYKLMHFRTVRELGKVPLFRTATYKLKKTGYIKFAKSLRY